MSAAIVVERSAPDLTPEQRAAKAWADAEDFTADAYGIRVLPIQRSAS